MHSATDFDAFYATPDPWRLSRTPFRDRVLRDRLHKYIAGKSVLDLGCGEGHLAESVFSAARAVQGIDISEIAIGRAKARNLPNARFETGDFLQTSFAGFDVIAALECMYYLTQSERHLFFAKIVHEHRGKPVIVSAPIIGKSDQGDYSTHAELISLFRRNGFSVIEHRNIFVDWRNPAEIIAGRLVRLPLCMRLMDKLPESFIRQRAYVIAAR